MAELIAVISDLIAKRRAGTATLADYVAALRVVVAFVDTLLQSQTNPVIGDADSGELLAVAEEFSVETTGESLSVPSEGGAMLPIVIAILKLLASAA